MKGLKTIKMTERLMFILLNLFLTKQTCPRLWSVVLILGFFMPKIRMVLCILDLSREMTHRLDKGRPDTSRRCGGKQQKATVNRGVLNCTFQGAGDDEQFLKRQRFPRR